MLAILSVCLAALLSVPPQTPGQIGSGPNPLTQVQCLGSACGGPAATPYLYRVTPVNVPIESLEVSVEDGDIGHYTLIASPAGWDMTIVSIVRSHELRPTEHGDTTTKSGTCPYVLRFSKGTGAAQSGTFDLGYAYTPGGQYHDVQWKTSDGVLGVWGQPLGASRGPVHSPLRCNVLLIVLDDVGTDKVARFDDPTHSTPPALHAHARTPNLEALANAGIQFSRFYVNPVCSTTRACLQTGRYSFQHGIGALSSVPLADAEVTVAELVRNGFPAGQGYSAAAFGKWHLTPLAGGDQEHAVRNGYELFEGTMANALKCVPTSPADAQYNWARIHAETGTPPSSMVACVDCGVPSLCPPMIGCSAPDYCTDQACAPMLWNADVVRRDAKTWINARPEPFLAWVAFNPPHYPLSAPPCTTDDGRSLLSCETRDELKALGLFPGKAPPGTFAARDLVYRAMLEAVDWEIRYLLDDIGAFKADRTMVFVISDNGTEPEMIDASHQAPVGQPQHGKDSVYQLGVRVPMLVSGPLVAPAPGGGWESFAMAGAVDLWKTVRDITGADESLAFVNLGVPAPQMFNNSLFSVIRDPTSMGSRTYAFSQIFTPSGASIEAMTNHARIISDGAYTYLRRLTSGTGTSCEPTMTRCYEEEFYEVADADETTDLLDAAGEPPMGLEGVFASLRAQMITLSGD